MAFHVGPNGPGECKAQKGRCPFGSPEEHFNSLEEATKAHEKLLTPIAEPKLSKIAKYPLTAEEKALRRANYEAAQDLVANRAAAGEVIFDDANLKRAQRRLEESIEYAKSRGNSHLVDKLSSSSVLPSGAFRTAEGQRVNTDAVLKSYAAIKAVEEARDQAIKALTLRLKDEPIGTKFSHKDTSGTYTLTVAEELDAEAYDALPEKLRISISSEKESIDSELAKELLTKEEYESISHGTQVIDYVIGKPPTHGVPELTLRESTSIQRGLEDIAHFYAATHTNVGKVRDLKNELAEGSSAIKTTAAKKTGNTFAPARSQYNGAVVSGRRTIDPKKAAELLTPEKLASLKKTTFVPDKEKAKLLLSAKDFGTIFQSKKLALRVTESKD